MTRPPHACISGRFIPFRATELKRGANDALRCFALCCPSNDNPLFGRPFGPGAA